MIIVTEERLDMSTYIQTRWVTYLRVLHLLNMSFVLDQRERETLKKVWGSLIMVPLYHGWL
jgi:hypothetical protein